MLRKANLLTPGTMLACSMVLSINAGCILERQNTHPTVSSLPASNAPSINLSFASAPTLSLVSHQLAPRVAFVDARVPEEKLYYPGEAKSDRKADAMAVLPLESFQPHLEKALREKVVASLTDAGDYELIEIRLTSFHVALDERPALASPSNEEATSADAPQDAPSETTALLNRLTASVGKAVAPVSQRVSSIVQRDRDASATNLPALLTADKQPGWNCVLQADIVLIDRNGDQRTLEIGSASHAPDQPAADTNRQIEQLVADTLNSFTDQLKSRDQQADRSPLKSGSDG